MFFNNNTGFILYPDQKHYQKQLSFKKTLNPECIIIGVKPIPKPRLKATATPTSAFTLFLLRHTVAKLTTRSVTNWGSE